MMEPKFIYYLDDDKDDLDFFRDATKALGHEVMTFQNGNEMLSALRYGKQPDIIFLDIHMPILKGEEMLQILKKSEEWKHLPVVMISGAYPKKLVRYYLEVGANYLMKKSHDLKPALEQVLGIDWKNFHAFA